MLFVGMRHAQENSQSGGDEAVRKSHVCMSLALADGSSVHCFSSELQQSFPPLYCLSSADTETNSFHENRLSIFMLMAIRSGCQQQIRAPSGIDLYHCCEDEGKKG